MGKPEWFKDNYKIHILDPDRGEKAADEDAEEGGVAQRRSISKKKELPKKKELLEGIRPFSSDDLRLLELSLEPMSGTFLNLLRETPMVRKAVALVLQDDGVTVTQRPDIQGVTHVDGGEFTVVIYPFPRPGG